MSVEVISIVALAVVFLIATVLPVHMGALAFVAAFLIGTVVVGESTDDIVGGFPGDLFVILAGVTFLFAIAKNNGTVDWLVAASVRLVGGRVALIPWMMFLVTAVLTAIGAVVPAAVAIIAPVGLGFALRYRINPVLMGLLIINGASAGGFSPISIFGGIVNGVVASNNLPSDPFLLFISSFVFNVVLSVVVFFLFGGRELLSRGRETVDGSAPGTGTGSVAGSARGVEQTIGGTTLAPAAGSSPTPTPTPTASAPAPSSTPTAAPSSTPTAAATGTTTEPGPAALEPVTSPGLNLDRSLTLVGLAVLAIGALFFGLDVGFTAITVAVVLSLISPQSAKPAVGQIAWPTVLLICGVVTYVSLMERIGTIDFLGDAVTGIGVPLLAAFVICLIGAAVSAFASTTGILGALIPLAVPFLLSGQIAPVALIIALSISSSVVDSSPFSTSGALVVANAAETERDLVYRRLLAWGMSMVIVAPIVTWMVFILPS